MANFAFNISKGREAEFHWRVDNNDPANSALILVVLAAATLEPDATLQDYDTLADVLAISLEVTNGSYARKTLTDASISPFTVDDTFNLIRLPLANQTFTTIAAGDSWAKLLICYDSDTTGGTDANIIPVVAQDLLVSGVAVVPNGSDIVVAFPTGYAVCS